MNTLEKLDEKMQRLGEMANKKLEEIPSNVQGSWSSAIGVAKEQLAETRKEYREVLFHNAVGLFIKGDAAKVVEFAELAKAEGGIVADANSLYERLAVGIEPSISDRRIWGVQQTYLLHMQLQGVMSELSIFDLPTPGRVLDVLVPDHDAVVKLCRKLIWDGIGTGLNALYLENQVVQRALEIRYIGLTVPIMIVNATTEDERSLSNSFFGKGETSVVVGAEDEINKDFISKTLKKIRKK